MILLDPFSLLMLLVLISAQGFACGWFCARYRCSRKQAHRLRNGVGLHEQLADLR